MGVWNWNNKNAIDWIVTGIYLFFWWQLAKRTLWSQVTAAQRWPSKIKFHLSWRTEHEIICCQRCFTKEAKPFHCPKPECDKKPTGLRNWQRRIRNTGLECACRASKAEHAEEDQKYVPESEPPPLPVDNQERKQHRYSICQSCHQQQSWKLCK